MRYDRMIAKLDQIITGQTEQYDERIFAIEKEILSHHKPNNWNTNVEGNMERQIEVDFQKFAIMVLEGSSQSIEQTTTFTFYARVENIRDKHAKNKQR